MTVTRVPTELSVESSKDRATPTLVNARDATQDSIVNCVSDVKVNIDGIHV